MSKYPAETEYRNDAKRNINIDAIMDLLDDDDNRFMDEQRRITKENLFRWRNKLHPWEAMPK